MLFEKSIQSNDKVAPFHDPLKILKLKTLASDCVIEKDVTTMPLCYNIKQVRKEDGKSNWKIPLCDDDATREKIMHTTSNNFLVL